MKEIIGFNTIIVFQSLPDNEPQTGSTLYQDIIQRRTNLQKNDLSSKLVNIENRIELFDQLNLLTEDFQQRGVIPYLHFEIHGCLNGFVLKNMELIEWSELTSVFSAINDKIKNNLVISLATCYGFFMINAIDPQKRSPFNAYIGAPKEITIDSVEKDWQSYFNELLITKDFNAALIALNNQDEQPKYLYETSINHFNRIWNLFQKKYANRKGRRKRFTSLLSRATSIPEITNQHDEQKVRTWLKKFVADLPQQKKQHREYFLFKRDTPYDFPPF